MADTVLTSDQVAALTKLHEDLGKLLASLNGTGSGLFKRHGLTREQADARIRSILNERRKA